MIAAPYIYWHTYSLTDTSSYSATVCLADHWTLTHTLKDTSIKNDVIKFIIEANVQFFTLISEECVPLDEMCNKAVI